jgi:hypothetical protein
MGIKPNIVQQIHLGIGILLVSFILVIVGCSGATPAISTPIPVGAANGKKWRFVLVEC